MRVNHIPKICTLVLLVRCSTQFSSLHSGSERRTKTIYEVKEDQAFRLAYLALASTHPGREVTPIEGHVRGYTAYNRFGIDTFTANILVIPASGVTPDGREVTGFYSRAQGAAHPGRPRSNETYENLERDLQGTGTAVEVRRLLPASYQAGLRGRESAGGRVAE